MKLLLSLLMPVLAAAAPVVVDHVGLKDYGLNGIELMGVATEELGSKEFEVWRSSMPPGTKTPVHTHTTEEIMVYLQGSGRAWTAEGEVEFKAPCTLILPAGVPHQIINSGDVPTEAVVILGLHSEITNQEGVELNLPWRR